MFRRLLDFVQRYERHLSVFAMAAGFIADSFFFERVDLVQTQLVFAAYMAVCFVSIPLLHWLESRSGSNATRPRVRALLPLATQFALGGLWSGFVIFYGRSAVVGASWPFLAFLVLVLLGSEYFHRYRARLVFTSVLFFFALYSYAIFAVPIALNSIGTATFLISGIVAVATFAVFSIVLRIFAQGRFLEDIQRIRLGALGVFVLMNVFYFTNILPPLPLSAVAGGIYHQVERIPGAYIGAGEGEPWYVRYLGYPPTMRVVSGGTVFAYSSVFAPAVLATTIRHRWQWYDPGQDAWVTKAIVAYPILGGRDGGYRGYSKVFVAEAGEWRVTVETADGRAIDRLPFMVERVSSPPALQTFNLK